MNPKDLILLLIGVALIIGGVFFMIDFLKTFLPFAIGIIMVVVGLYLASRKWG